MKNIQFGSSSNLLDGWINLQEHDGDITKPLAFEDNSIDYVLIEHVVEHVTQKQAYLFFRKSVV